MTADRYRQLEAEPLIKTATRLGERIRARFPDRNLASVADALEATLANVAGHAEPPRWLGVLRQVSRATAVLIAVSIPLVIVSAIVHAWHNADLAGFEWIAVAESAINDLVFSALAIIFLWAAPVRLLRSRALKQAHELRTMAHVIDMHQLAKDPDRFRVDYEPTSASNDPALTPSQLSTYLDYCSEMLSLVAKGAALLASHHDDPAVLSAVRDVEQLCIGLSSKIWQKIGLLPQIEETFRIID